MTSRAFLHLSALLQYRLSGSPVDWKSIADCIFSNRKDGVAEGPVIDTLIFLDQAMGREKRRLGPFAILHPIRTAALYWHADDKPQLLNVLTALLHDKDEDIIQERHRQNWQDLLCSYEEFLMRINARERWFLNERIHLLARTGNETYTEYIGRLVDKSDDIPELLVIKLADRLDNTFDLRLDIDRQAYSLDCLEVIFLSLFPDRFPGIKAINPHPVERKINGAYRLYQIFKGMELIRIIREHKIELPSAGRRLLHGLVDALFNETREIILHLLMYHIQGTESQREAIFQGLLFSRMQEPSTMLSDEDKVSFEHLAKHYFLHSDSHTRHHHLDLLYKDKMIMCKMAIQMLKETIAFRLTI